MGGKGEGSEMKLECIKDVIMNVGSEKMFTKGKLYDSHYHYRENWGKPYTRILCDKNDLGITHCIKNTDNSTLDGFFHEHFREDEK